MPPVVIFFEKWIMDLKVRWMKMLRKKVLLAFWFSLVFVP